MKSKLRYYSIIVGSSVMVLGGLLSSVQRNLLISSGIFGILMGIFLLTRESGGGDVEL